ncbi:IS66 family insertion sequence element accessory protein TnpA [Thiolapillus sp.]|uniref:IS66 family insertion sequence element accessory protein TnpA n=1 Tax=Thiolapillus sp. TaxID=2017437 RepID=UPI003AF4E090
MTQKAYCEAHGLRYATFGYWVRKLRTPSGDHQESASGFIPVTLAASHGERSEGW